MQCPFSDPAALADMTPERREELQQMYHQMKKDTNSNIKVTEPEPEDDTRKQEDQKQGGGRCPFGMTEDQDPQELIERLAQMEDSGGSCPVMGGKYFDPFNMPFEPGYNCVYRSRWDFLLNFRGRLSDSRWKRERKTLNKMPTPLLHTLFYPDGLKKLRTKPFSGLFFNLDK